MTDGVAMTKEEIQSIKDGLNRQKLFSALECIEFLENENEELKEKLEIEEYNHKGWFGKAVTKDRQLNEAMEIVRMYYLYCPSSEYSYEDIEKKAESLFRELEK